MFDLPTLTLADKRDYRKFRKYLLSEGFIMHQYSVYTKLLLNDNQTNAMIARLKKNHPGKGHVNLLKITEKQFAKMVYLHGEKDASIANSDARLVFLGGDIFDTDDV